MRRGFARRLGVACAVVVASGLCAAAVLLGAVAALGLSAPPAPTDESLNATGSITYTWQGDPSRGCAAVGVCDVRGALIIDAQGPADAQRHGRQTFVNLANGAATVRVVTGTGQNASECIDAPPSQAVASVVMRPSPSGLIGTIVPALSSGRCAGPLAQDLQGLRLAVKRSAGSRPSFDLRGSQSFVAGPFSGALVSTLVLRPVSGGGGQASSTSGFFPGPPTHKVLTERVSLRYTVTSLTGTLETSFAGTPESLCAGLASCGASGSLSFSLTPARHTLTLTASRTVRRRVGARQAIADFKAGRLGNPFGEIAPAGVGTVVTESFAGGDGSRCQDSSSSRQLTLLTGLPMRAPGLQIALFERENLEILRTHCPGPTDTDVLGGSPTVARGSVSLAALLAPRSVVSLSNPGGFGGPGYVGSRSGAIDLSLALERVRAGTVEGRAP